MSTTVLTPLLQAASQTTATAPAIGSITPYNASAGALAPTLPALSGLNVGDRLGIQKDPADNSPNLVTPTCSGADTFYGGATTAPIYITGEQRILHVVSVAGTKYWKVPDSINPIASLDKRYPAANLELYEDFTAAANGAPTVADSGQAWGLTSSRAGGALPSISGGRYINAEATTFPSATYLWAQIGASTTYMEADFDFGSAGSTAGQNATVVAWGTTPPAIIGTVPDSPAHVVFKPGGYDYGVWSGNAYTVVRSYTYPVVPGTQTQHVEVTIDKVNGIGYVRDFSGHIEKFSHSLINTVSAAFPCAEVYYTASTDNRSRFQKFSASSKSLADFDQHPNRARTLMLQGLAFNPWRKVTTTAAASSTTTSATAFTNTTIPGLSSPNFIAPPSGSVIARISVFVSVTTASNIFIQGSFSGTTSGLVAEYIRWNNTPASDSKLFADLVYSGLTPGGQYSIAGGVGCSVSSGAVIVIGANKSATIVVEPVY